MMKKIYALILSIAAVILMPLGASALSGADFNPARIIDDLVFFNKNSMTVQQIQDFLNSKVPTCDSNHAGFSGGTGTLYNPPFICLKDFYENPNAPYTVNFTYKNTSGVDTVGSRTYYENNSYRYTSLAPVYKNGDYTQGYSLKGTITNMAGVKPAGSISAAQIIYNASQTYNINPQVLLVTLQKEQGLVTDTWPAAWQYQAAMGYGCPDTAPCSVGYAGFSRQVFSAAYQFRLYTDNPDSYNFKGGTTRYIQYNPTASCGGTNVAIVNQATANLYNYTPYQPNAGALANMSDSSAGGSASCGAYGNRNFFWYFNKWFGDTRITVISPIINSYNKNEWIGKPLMNQDCKLTKTGCYQLFERGSIYWTADSGAQYIHGGIKDKWIKSGSENGNLGYPTSGELANPDGGVYQTFQGGKIYWSNTSGAVSFSSNIYDTWTSLGASSSFVGKPITDSICGLKNNGCYQLFEKRTIYWTADSGAQYIHGGIKDKWIKSGSENGNLGYPTSGELANPDGGVYQTFQGGKIYWKSPSDTLIVYN